MVRSLLLASTVLATGAVLSGCGSGQADTASTAEVGGNILIGDQTFAFTSIVCLQNGSEKSPQAFLIMGEGETADGRRFDIHADGERNRVELRVKGTSGPAVAIYTSSFQPGALRLEGGSVAIEGDFHRIAEGGIIPGRFQARCP